MSNDLHDFEVFFDRLYDGIDTRFPLGDFYNPFNDLPFSIICATANLENIRSQLTWIRIHPSAYFSGSQNSPFAFFLELELRLF